MKSAYILKSAGGGEVLCHLEKIVWRKSQYPPGDGQALQ